MIHKIKLRTFIVTENGFKIVYDEGKKHIEIKHVGIK